MATTAGQIGLNMVLNSSQFRQQINGIKGQAETASTKISSSFKKIGAAIAATFSVAMIKKFAKDCTSAAAVQTEAETKLTTVMQQRMKATTSSIQKIKEYASAQQDLGVVGDEVQLSGAQQLSTFLKTDSALKTLIPAMNNLAVQQNGVTVGASDMVNIGNLMGKAMQGQTSALTRVGITFDEAEEKVMKYGNEQERAAMLAQIITNNVGQMNEAIAKTPAGRIQQLKNSFGDMQETIGRALNNVFMPLLKYINAAVQRLSALSSKFEEFTAKIFGNSNNSVTSFSGASESVENLTDEAENSSAAIDGVADSAEKAKRSIAGFDKLNILSKENKTESDSSTSAVHNSTGNNNLTSAMSKSIDKFTSTWNTKGQRVINSIKKSFNSIKGAAQSIGESWSNVWNNGSGKKLLNNIKSLLSNIFDIIGNIAESFKKAWNKADLGNKVVQSVIDRINSLIELVNTIAKDFKEVWNSGVGERIWSNILEIVKNCNKYTTTLRNKIKEAWDKNETGKRIWKTILGIVEDITGFLKEMSEIRLEWLESLDLSPIVEAVADLGEAFRELLKACGDKLKAVYKNILLPLAKWTIEKAVPKLVEALAGALKLISNVIKNINDDTLYAIAGGIAAVATAVIVFKTGQAIANGIAKVQRAISTILTTISANPLLAIASAIGGIVLAVKTYNDLKWENSEAKKFSDEIAEIKSDLEETTAGIEDNLKNTLDKLDNMYADNTIVDSYQEKLMELLEKAELTPEEQSQLETIVTYFDKNVDGFRETWNKYVTVSDTGKVNLKGDLTEIQTEINNTIDEYQKLANVSALSELSTENKKEQISARRDLAEVRQKMDDKEQEAEENYWRFRELLDDSMEPYEALETLKRIEKDDKDVITNAAWGEAYNTYRANKKELEKLKKTYNESVKEVNRLTMTEDDLLDVQKVLKGDFSDAAAVMMAYNQQMIDQNDILSATDENGKKIWKSMEEVSEAAKESGKNTVLGLVEGTKEYQGALVKNSNGLASTVISEYDRSMEIHSPSKAMYKRGAWTVQGLVIGISDTTDMVKSTLQQMVDEIREKINPIKDVFSGAFSGIWAVIRNPLNWLMEKLEKFINGFISGINELASGVDWVVSNVGDIFGQDWHVGQFEKVTLPRFAKGAIVKAPTLAVVGDNAGANSGNPEVISPLNKLQSMINTSSGQDVVVLGQILDYLKRIYEMFIVFRNNGGNTYEFVANLNGSQLFNEVVRQNELSKKRHNGKSVLS